MVRIDIGYESELRSRAIHEPSGTEVLTDAPVDNHGRGESFSPTDLVATALGSCMLTIMGVAAQKHGWDIRGSRAVVEKHMVADPKRRIGKLSVAIHIAGEHDDRARTTLERAALGCPVHRTLGDNVEIPVHFHWGEPV